MLPSTRELLRSARGIATTLRNILEEVQGDLDSGRETSDQLGDELESAVTESGIIESWLDSLKINEDGTSADDGQ